jgi:hypothetical protein
VTGPQRRFPTAAEVEEWISARFVDPAADPPADPAFDQMKAALDESVGRLEAAAPYLVAAGKAELALTSGSNPDRDDRYQLRAVARQVIAAESVGMRPLCPHVQMIRPMLVICDPPAIIYTDCLTLHRAEIMAELQAVGHCWNSQCDRCGVHTEHLTPVTVGGFSYFTVSGHVCRTCADDDRRWAMGKADQVVMVERPRQSRQRRRRCRSPGPRPSPRRKPA